MNTKTFWRKVLGYSVGERVIIHLTTMKTVDGKETFQPRGRRVIATITHITKVGAMNQLTLLSVKSDEGAVYHVFEGSIEEI